MVQEIWAKEYGEGLDVRPTISQTKAHIKIEELDVLARKGEFPVDGDIVIKSPELPSFPGVDQGVEVNTYKAAVDPVWYLPGVAERLGIDESTLRRALFEDTGGMYPELLTRPDIKIFLPPIGGMTVYIMGDPAKLSDPNTEVTCRPHDSCSGSDVFGSDICTCRPYLIFGISEAIKCAQRGGVGVVVYFQKEGRALGEVVKYSESAVASLWAPTAHTQWCTTAASAAATRRPSTLTTRRPSRASRMRGTRRSCPTCFTGSESRTLPTSSR